MWHNQTNLFYTCPRHINCVHSSHKGQQSVFDPETKQHGQPSGVVFMARDINRIGGEHIAEGQGTFKGAKAAKVDLHDCEEQREPNLRHQINSWREPFPELCLGLISERSGREQANSKARFHRHQFISVDGPRQNAEGMA